MVLEKTLESPLDCKEIQPVQPKGNQSWIFIRRTDAKAETPILWPPNVKSRLIGQDLDVGKEWGQEVKGITEDETVGWHHWLNGLEFEHTIWSLWLKLPTPNRHTHWSLDSCPIEIPCGIHCIKICDFYGSAKNQSLITLTRILWINKTNTFAPKDNTHSCIHRYSPVYRG